MSWICPKCETENSDRLNFCEVCDSPREISPVELLKKKLKEKYSEAAYKTFIRYHYDLLASADKGNSVDQYKVGEWFFNKNSADYYKIAAIWFFKAANQGHMYAQAKLAVCYEDGYGVPKDKDAAIKWYREAANKGDEAARSKYLKLKYSSNTYKAIIRYRITLLADADNGNRDSQFQLGEWFSCHNSQSSYGTEAIFWFEKAAESGHGDAMLKLGECYENGTGVYSNYSEAIKWYKKAANRGNAPARLKLAKAYLYGNMVAKNVGEAIRWYELVGRGLNAADLCTIGYAYDTGDTVFMNKTKAVEYYRLAAEKGDLVAQYNLGVCYENGNGVYRDINTAKYWYEKSAGQGYSQAQQCASRVNSEIQSRKRKDGVSSLISALIFGTIYGLFGYLLIIEILPKWGINILEIWPNTQSAILIICVVIGIIIVAFFDN